MNLFDSIKQHKPKSIFDVVPETVFAERDDPAHPYIRSRNCYEWKYAISKFLQPGSVLEIGVRLGYSLASFVMASGRLRYAEGWDDCLYLPNSNTLAERMLAGLPKKFQLKLYKLDCQTVDDFGPCFDLVHIDGPHTYASTMHCLNLCKGKTGAILVDDSVSCPDDGAACRDFVAQNKDLVRDTVQINSERGDFLILLRSQAGF